MNLATDRTIRIVIAEDHRLIAAGLCKLLESQFGPVTIVANGRDLLDVVKASKPDLALIDIAMPLLNGIEATIHIRKISPSTKVVIVTVHNEPQYIAEAFRAGASGYILKRCAFSELVTAIRGVLDGQPYVTPLMGVSETARPFEPSGPALTLRQREVLRLVAEGCTAKEIANTLELSVKTAVFHKMAIMDKLGLHTTAELTRYAMEHGIAPAADQALASAKNSARKETEDGPSSRSQN